MIKYCTKNRNDQVIISSSNFAGVSDAGKHSPEFNCRVLKMCLSLVPYFLYHIFSLNQEV